jgi:tetratricopeptide (TPR) repeat protein
VDPAAQYLDELRRRIQEDPASLLFADLAEECRRQGLADEAVSVVRAGLAHHPSHLDARVTLSRALIDLHRLDAAFVELTGVLDEAPDNVAAVRALAEVHQRRGLMGEALVHYQRALELAQLQTPVPPNAERTLEDASSAAARPGAAPAGNPSVEDLFDFDTLLAQLGQTPPESERIPPPATSPIQAIDSADDEDDFAVMERHLREFEEQRARDERIATQAIAERRRLLILQNLEHWLGAIVADKNRPIA